MKIIFKYEEMLHVEGCICLEPIHFGIFEALYLRTGRWNLIIPRPGFVCFIIPVRACLLVTETRQVCCRLNVRKLKGASHVAVLSVAETLTHSSSDFSPFYYSHYELRSLQQHSNALRFTRAGCKITQKHFRCSLASLALAIRSIHF